MPVDVTKQQVEEKRSACERRDHSDWNFTGREKQARKSIADDQKRAAAQRRGRQQVAVVRAGQAAQRVRNNQTDKSDHAGKRDGGGCGQRGGAEHQRQDETCLNTEVARGRTAEQQGVQRVALAEKQRGGNGDQRGHSQHERP